MIDSIGAAEELEGVAHTALVELHGVGIETDRDGTVLEKPLGHLSLILTDLHPTSNPGRHSRPVELARLVLPVVAVVRLSLQTSDLQDSLRQNIID